MAQGCYKEHDSENVAQRDVFKFLLVPNCELRFHLLIHQVKQRNESNVKRMSQH
jgi:hypothetical protein